MCQYDLGFNQYCTNRECDTVKFVIQEQFHEDDDRVLEAFSAGPRQPCGCSNRWFRWHYHATRSGRDQVPARYLCEKCGRAKRGFRGTEAEADEQWPEQPENMPSVWTSHKRIESRFRGYMQEMDIMSGDPIVEGRVIKTVDYSPKGGSKRGSPDPEIFGMSPEPENRYLEDVERVTKRVTVYQDKGKRLPSPHGSKRSVRFSADTPSASKGSRGAKRETRNRIDSKIPEASFTPVWHIVENTQPSDQLPRLEHYTNFSRWFDENVDEEQTDYLSEDESRVSSTSSAPIPFRTSTASRSARRSPRSESRASTPTRRRSRDGRYAASSATSAPSEVSTETRAGGRSEDDETEVSSSAATPSEDSSVYVRQDARSRGRGGAGRYSGVRESEEFYD